MNKFSPYMHTNNISCKIDVVTISGVARPGPTRACALPSTFQALPSAAQQIHVIPLGIKQEGKYSSYSS